jgi:hypothetical protein
MFILDGTHHGFSSENNSADIHKHLSSLFFHNFGYGDCKPCFVADFHVDRNF